MADRAQSVAGLIGERHCGERRRSEANWPEV